MVFQRNYCLSSFVRFSSFLVPRTQRTNISVVIPSRRIMQRPLGLPLSEVVRRLENFAPKWLAEPWDNVGLLLEPCEEKAVTSVLLTNDLTEDVADEAVTLGVQLIISYHPPVFKPMKTITNKHWKTRIVSKCLGKSIAVYSPHTCYDAVAGGVNDWLADAFEYQSKRPITPSTTPAEPHSLKLEECGAGRVLELTGPITLADAVTRVKKHLGAKHVHLARARSATIDSEVRSVALCAGSGASVLADVNADLLLTGEMSHHEVLDAVHRGSSVILTWHSTSERGFLAKLAQQLKTEVLDCLVNVHISQADAEPIVTM